MFPAAGAAPAWLGGWRGLPCLGDTEPAPGCVPSHMPSLPLRVTAHRGVTKLPGCTGSRGHPPAAGMLLHLRGRASSSSHAAHGMGRGGQFPRASHQLQHPQSRRDPAPPAPEETLWSQLSSLPPKQEGNGAFWDLLCNIMIKESPLGGSPGDVSTQEKSRIFIPVWNQSSRRGTWS